MRLRKNVHSNETGTQMIHQAILHLLEVSHEFLQVICRTKHSVIGILTYQNQFKDSSNRYFLNRLDNWFAFPLLPDR